MIAAICLDMLGFTSYGTIIRFLDLLRKGKMGSTAIEENSDVLILLSAWNLPAPKITITLLVADPFACAIS